MANLETELKYLINKLPDNITNPIYIEQRYFKMDNVEEQLKKLFNLESLEDISTSRIRLIKNKKISYVLTLKTKGLYSRVEYEQEISKELYDLLLNQPIESCVIKNRYKVNINDYIFEFDEYLNLNTKLYTVEIEVDDIQTHQQILEDILQNEFELDFIDVTLNPKYKNSNLIKYFG